METSKSFLVSYLNSLLNLTLSNEERTKGKTPITFVDTSSTTDVRVGPSSVPWLPPEEGWAKLNIHGTWSAEAGTGTGMVLRDNVGGIIFSSCRVLYSCSSPLEAEISACMESLSIAIQRT
ncbi:autophagy-related protein 7 [Hordeum vulgare]|nr:autophagy-related protein 7 [Hordeum vulgare]